MSVTLLNDLPSAFRMADKYHGFSDHFEGFLTAQSGASYTVVTAVDGTVLMTDAARGAVLIANATASIGDNEDCYLAREPEAFLLAANKPLVYRAILKFTEVSTNTCNVIAGITDAVAADLLVNDGAGPKTSGTTLAFFKKDGNLNWHVHVSLSTTQTSVELTAANSLDKVAHAAGGSSYQVLDIEFIPKNSTQSDVNFYIDGVHVYKMSDYVFTSATEAQAVVGCKGGTAAAMTVNLDFMGCYQQV
jgi:hypothetical protein